MDKQAEYDARWLESLVKSIKVSRITNGYGDGGCGDEKDTDVEDGDTDDDDYMMMIVVLMVTAAQDVAPGDDDDDVDHSNGGDDDDNDEIDGD